MNFKAPRVPGKISPFHPQAWNRYNYTLGNSIKYNDPSGHGVDCGIGMGNCVSPYVPPSFMQSPNINDDEGVGGSIIPTLIPSPSQPTATETPPPPIKLPPIINTSSTPKPANSKDFVCTTPMPGSQNNCSPSLKPDYIYDYTYEGSIIPVVGLVVDLGGMIVDGASILLLLGIGVLGVPSVAGLESGMTVFEMLYSAGMNITGQYDAVYDHASSILDPQIARYTDTQEMVPIVGFTASLTNAINNIQVISEDIVAHRVYLTP